jgi:hypothetical protein
MNGLAETPNQEASVQPQPIHRSSDPGETPHLAPPPWKNLAIANDLARWLAESKG